MDLDSISSDNFKPPNNSAINKIPEDLQNIHGHRPMWTVIEKPCEKVGIQYYFQRR